MKIIIAGAGKVGNNLANQLCKGGYDLTMIDLRQKVLEKSVENYDVMALHGNCASMNVLKEAGVQDAELLIAATGADEINMLCCLTAHGMNPELHTIARIRNPEYIEQTYEMRDSFGLSMTVNPEQQAAAEIEQLLKYPGFLKRDTFAKGRVEIVEYKVKEDSKICRTTLMNLNSIVKCRVLVCAVQRENKVIIPDGNFMISEGDRLFVTASSDNLTTLLRNLGIIKHKVRRVLICGGSRISYYLAQNLCKNGVDVQIIEKNPQRCLELADLLPDACVVEGDVSDHSVLEREGIDSCDALIALTGFDELNIIISLYAKNCGVSRIFTKVAHISNSRIVNALDLDSVICPKELCGNSIVRYVRAINNQTGAAMAMHTIADGQAEAMEFWVDETTLHCGEPLKNIRFRPNVLLACINHGWAMQIPDGDTTFDNGDILIVVTNKRNVITQLNDIFI